MVRLFHGELVLRNPLTVVCDEANIPLLLPIHPRREGCAHFACVSWGLGVEDIVAVARKRILLNNLYDSAYSSLGCRGRM